MEKAKIIAIWLECGIDIAPCTADESFPTTGLEGIGTIKNKSTTLEATDGETLELKATGGHTVDIVETEGGFALKTTVIEPTKLYKALGLTEDDYDTNSRIKETQMKALMARPGFDSPVGTNYKRQQ